MCHLINQLLPHLHGISQFFIVYGDSQLDPLYTVFGSVDPATLGVVQGIADAGIEGDFADGPPATPVTIDGVTVN